MSTLITTTISGITNPVLVNGEYSTQAITDAYQNDINVIAQIYDSLGVPSSSNPNVHAPTPTDVQNIQAALNDLLNLAQNGIVDPNGTSVPDPNNPGQTIKKAYLTLEMAQSVDAIQKSLSAVGFFDALSQTLDPNAATNALGRWKDLSYVGLSDIIQNALNASQTNRTLQAMLEINYVGAGNDQIYSALSSLQDSLNATNDALNLLKTIQDLHNLVNPQGVSTVGVNAFTSGNPVSNLGIGSADAQFSSWDAYTSAYQAITDPIFGNPIDVVPDGDPTTPVPAGGQGDAISSENMQQFTQLQSQLPSLISKLDALNGQTAATRTPGSLADQLQQVLNDINNASGTTPQDKFNSWLADGYGSTTNPNTGNIQRHITEAITQAQSLNDQQKEQLQSQMFVFEEFYKSSSDALSTISQIIVKMAQGISG